jgi:hypothetical protein
MASPFYPGLYSICSSLDMIMMIMMMKDLTEVKILISPPLVIREGDCET